jgi:two-component system sensor histidine kinase YesM
MNNWPIILIILFFTLIIPFVMMRLLGQSITDRISILGKAFGEGSNEYFQPIKEIKGADEISELMRNYNTIVDINNELTNTIYKEKLREQESDLARKNAELLALQSQINPHFLFNSLNAIYALIAMDQDKAQEATHALSNLLRYVLNEKNEEMVPLDDELKFTQDYIDLMSMRFSSDMLSLKVEMPDDAQGWRIAPMLFMTLIENAFKHGISNASPSFILVLIHIADEKIFATVSNSRFPKNEPDRRGGGIGLDNLSKRLELIYGEQASMTVTQEEDSYTTKLEIPLRR